MAAGVQHLVGREEELGALLGLLSDELPAVAVVVGEAGIGKTTLWLAAVEAAAAARIPGAVVPSVRSGGRIPVRRARRPDPERGRRRAAGAPRPQRRALETALALSEPGGARAEEGVVAFAFLNVLKRVAARNRLLLAIDDVQWLDAPSLAMLQFALARLEVEARRHDPERTRRSAALAAAVCAGGTPPHG